jgi:hypothetical protein
MAVTLFSSGSVYGTILMSRIGKLIERMRNNPRDWRIEDVKTVADYYLIDYRQPDGSHVTFRFINATKLTVPAHKPIKAIYIKKFIALLDDQESLL